MRRRSVRARQAPRSSPVGGVGQHASPSRRRSPVRTRYRVPAPPAGTTRPRPAARSPTWWNADTPDPKPGAARRGGASPPVGTTPPAPAGPRPLYRRVRGSTPRGGSGRATAAGGSDGTQTCQPQKLVPLRGVRVQVSPSAPRWFGHNFTRLLRRRVPAARTGGGGGRHPEEALVGPSDRQRGSGGTVDTPGREPGAHKRVCGSESRLPHAASIWL